MNCAQALAIAAATFVAAGDPWTASFERAKEELAALANQGQSLGEAALHALTAEVLSPSMRRCKGDTSAA